MNDLLLKILFTLLGLYIGVLSWILKSAWAQIQAHAKELEHIRLECANRQKCLQDTNQESLDDLLAKISAMIDTKLDAWWNRIENNLMNDGRLPPKRRQKNPEQ